jgi:hypothetical protein
MLLAAEPNRGDAANGRYQQRAAQEAQHQAKQM